MHQVVINIDQEIISKGNDGWVFHMLICWRVKNNLYIIMILLINHDDYYCNIYIYIFICLNDNDLIATLLE